MSLSRIENFKFWCHKIIPLVYDDSLSYYEFLCKVMQKLNEVITQMNEQIKVINETEELNNDTQEKLNKIETLLVEGEDLLRRLTELATELEQTNYMPISGGEFSGTISVPTEITLRGLFQQQKISSGYDNIDVSIIGSNTKPRIGNIGDPLSANDVSNKNYVDTKSNDDREYTDSKHAEIINLLNSSLEEYIKASGGKFTGKVAFTGDADYAFRIDGLFDSIYVNALSGAISFRSGYSGACRLSNIADPVSANDGATKNYVDTTLGNIQGTIITGSGIPSASFPTEVEGNIVWDVINNLCRFRAIVPIYSAENTGNYIALPSNAPQPATDGVLQATINCYASRTSSMPTISSTYSWFNPVGNLRVYFNTGEGVYEQTAYAVIEGSYTCLS